MKARHAWAAVLVAVMSGAGAPAAEMGRQPIGERSGAAAAPLPIQRHYGGVVSAHGPGVDLGVDWTLADWKVGGASADDTTWGLRGDFFYGLSDVFDLRLSGRYAPARNSGDRFDMLRIGLGTRASFGVGYDLFPYVGVCLGYWTFDGESDGEKLSDVRGTIGIAGEAGLAYLVTEWLALRVGVDAEATVTDGKAEINGQEHDVSYRALGLGLAALILF
jgi:hypothetical protein